MKIWAKASLLGLSAALALSACSSSKTNAIETSVTRADMNAAELMVLKTGTWTARSFFDSKGLSYNANNPVVAGYAGVVRFYDNGTFRRVTLDAQSVYEGNWFISDDNRVMTFVGVGNNGQPGFKVEATFVRVNDKELVFRIPGNPANPNNRADYIEVRMMPASIEDSRVLTRQASVNPNSFTSIAN